LRTKWLSPSILRAPTVLVRLVEATVIEQCTGSTAAVLTSVHGTHIKLKKTQLPTFVLSPLSLTQNINVPIQPRCIVDDYFIALSSNRVLWSIFVLTTKHRPPLRALFDFGSPRFDFITHLELPFCLICMQ